MAASKPIAFRPRPEIEQALTRLAVRNGRSVHQEVVALVERALTETPAPAAPAGQEQASLAWMERHLATHGQVHDLAERLERVERLLAALLKGVREGFDAPPPPPSA